MKPNLDINKSSIRRENLTKYIIKQIVKYTDFLLTITVNLCLLPFHIYRIISAEKIILLSEGGYGHTVTAVQAANLIYPKKSCFIIFSQLGRHNWYQASIWNKIYVIHFFYFLKYPLKMNQQFFFSEIFKKLIYFFKQNEIVEVENQFNKSTPEKKIYSELIRLSPINSDLFRNSTCPQSSLWVPHYFCFLKNDQERFFSLKEKTKRKFWMKFENLSESRGKVLTFYLREKGLTPDGKLRNGPSFMDIESSLTKLVDEEYRILLIGDLCKSQIANKLKDKILDYNDFDLPKNVFNILAVTECERFIGSPGGGAWLPSLLDKPCLFLDAFPYGFGMSYSLILFKRIIDNKGRIIPLEECFRKYLWQYEFMNNFKIVHNSSLEIESAVDEFLSVKIEDWKSYVVPQEIFPENGWAFHGPSRLANYQYKEIRARHQIVP